MSRVLPMFPLGTVLVPGAILPLHVFEPRYRALVRDCTAGDGTFGVVLIERGSEVGGGDVRFDVGCVARIVDLATLDDGRSALVASGVARLRVRRWLEDDPYPRAEVDELEERPVVDHEALARAERLVRQCLALRSELDEPVPPATVALAADPTRAAWQLVALAPVGPLDRVRLLDEDDPDRRVALLAELAADEAGVLASRLADGQQ